MLEIVLKSEAVGHIGAFPITNTHIASTFVVLLFLIFALRLRSTSYSLKSQLYNIVEAVIEGFYSIVESTTGRKIATQIFPIIATFLLFILVNNWIGITPIFGSLGIYEPKTETVEEVTGSRLQVAGGEQGEGTSDKLPVTSGEHTTESNTEAGTHENAENTGEPEQVFVPILRSANSDLNTTLALAILSVIFIQYTAIGSIGFRKYLARFFNFKSPIFFFIGLLEILSELIKIFSFSFRLFGNIFAGDVLLVVISSLVPFIAPLPFIGLELFAGLIQSIVFSMLTIAFLKGHLSHAEGH